MVILENIDIDIVIDKAILQNIDIDKISNRFKFGISNRARQDPAGLVWKLKTWALYSVRRPCLKYGLSVPINALLKYIKFMCR